MPIFVGNRYSPNGGQGTIDKHLNFLSGQAVIARILRLEAFLTASAVGSSMGRTLFLARGILDPATPNRAPETASDGAIIGGTIGVILVLGTGLLGAKSLPEWTEVPAVVVAVQAGFSLMMGRVLTRWGGPPRLDPAEPTYEQIAFTLFGAITLPGLAIFIVTMTLVTLL